MSQQGQNDQKPPSSGAEREKQDQWKNEFDLKKKDLRLKVIDLKLKKKDMWMRIVIPIATVVIGLAQFYFQQRANEKLKFKADLWNRQHEMYLDVTNAIGEINNAIEYKKPDTAIEKRMISFKLPYWKSTLVEDSRVTRELINYNRLISLFMNRGTAGEDDKELQDILKKIKKQLLDSIPRAGEKVINTMSNSLEEESLEKWHDKK